VSFRRADIEYQKSRNPVCVQPLARAVWALEHRALVTAPERHRHLMVVVSQY